MTEIKMSIDLGEVTDLLAEIRDRLPQPAVPMSVMPMSTGDERALKSLALYTVLTVLNDWVEQARRNHEDAGHWGESMGDECWRSFAPEDIRSMINDAARRLCVNMFVPPSVPKEDEPL